jgi:tetratricopeptide (TPR) repeat protein
MVNPFAEYRLSLSILPIILIFSGLIYTSLKNIKILLISIVCAILIFLSGFTHTMNKLYRDTSLPWHYANQAYPNSLIIRQEIARNHLRFGNFNKVIEILDGIIKEKGHIPFQIFNLKTIIAHAYFFQKNYIKAYPIFQEIFSNNWKPQDYTISEYMITLYVLGKRKELEKFIIGSKRFKVFQKPVNEAIESILFMEKSKVSSSYSVIKIEQLIKIYYEYIK